MVEKILLSLASLDMPKVAIAPKTVCKNFII